VKHQHQKKQQQKKKQQLQGIGRGDSEGEVEPSVVRVPEEEERGRECGHRGENIREHVNFVRRCIHGFCC
jgi:hypothetical protein